MTPEQWQRVRDVLAEALALKPEQRPPFLDEACGSDLTLKREVETLLSSSDEVRSSFLQSSEVRITMTPGAKLGEYEVLRLVGSGGMGEVYRARDWRLGREVAIKVLPAFLSHDPERLRRFEQEARAAAALNHPNILAVFHMGTYEGAPYLVSELLEGGTLREVLARGSLPTRKAIDYGVQVARGLAAAHEKGIVHRDLKPENLFITRDGRLKILDFGLAKLTQRQSTDDSNAPTLTIGTEPGIVMGTVGYMSPEQVSGKRADHRADIFAFGAILYEMLTGKHAFKKPTSAETMTAILNEDPPSISQLARSTPPALQRIVQRCLEKNQDQRFQSASDLGFALEALSDSGSASVSAIAQAGAGSKYTTRAITVLLCAVVVAAIVATLWVRGRAGGPTDRSAWQQLTNLPDAVNQPALSPDGHMLTFIRGLNTFLGAGEVYVKMLPNGEPFELTHDGARKMSPMFSPDGSRIAYTVLGQQNTWDTWVVSVLGGKPHLWMPNAAALTWIDNERLLFSEIKQGQHMAIVTSTEGRAESLDLYVPTDEAAMAHRSYISPDRKWILVVEMNARNMWVPCRVVPMEGRSNGQAVGPPGAPCTSAAWSPDGKWMYLTANVGDNYHIWRQRFPNGRPEQLTSGTTEEEGIAVAADGNSLITAVGLRQRPIWFHDSSGARQISLEGYAFSPRLYLAGRKACYRNGVWRSQSTQSEIWLSDLDSGSVERLVRGFRVNTFHLSDDGKLVFSAFDDQGKPHIWLARLDQRSPPRQISSVDGDWPVIAHNGQVFFVGKEGNNDFLFVVREDGTGLAKLSPDPISEIDSLSPDGRWVSGLGHKVGEVGSLEFAYPTAGGSRVPLCDVPCIAGWARDGRYMYFSIPEGWMTFRGSGRTYVLPTRPGTMLPSIPPGGFQSPDQIASVPNVHVIEAADVDLGPSADIYVFSREVIQRNLYRIPLR
jgi:serine/threonine protein kinase/Tol biopolymer transport system component